MDKDNSMEYWNALKQPPPSALKTITGGRLSGMTDIKPQWRYQAMTEQFGMCGIGWKYIIDRQWVEESDGQKMAFCNVDLFVKVDGEWSDAIPGTGGSMIVSKEKSGLHASDEGFKMALTDALSVAMTRIGVASDIYMGNWNGLKYKSEQMNTPIDDTHRQEVVAKLKEAFSGDGPAVADWLKDHGLHQVRTANEKQLCEIEAALNE